MQNTRPFGVRDGLVYVPAIVKGEWKVAALDVRTGKQRWVRDNSGIPSLLFSRGLLTSASDGRGFIAYDGSGQVLWRSPDIGYCAPLALSGVPYAVCTTGGEQGKVTLLRLDPADGTARKLATLPAGVKGLGQTEDGQPLYAAPAGTPDDESRPRYSSLLRVDPRTGAVHRLALRQAVLGEPTLVGGMVAFVQPSGTVTAVAVSDGWQLWRRATGMESLSAPVPHAGYGRLYFCDREGEVLALDRDTGAKVWVATPPKSVGATAPAWEASVVLVKDSVVAMAGNSLQSLAPDQRSAPSA